MSDTDNISYEDEFTDIDDVEESPFDLAKVEIITASAKPNTKQANKCF